MAPPYGDPDWASPSMSGNGTTTQNNGLGGGSAPIPPRSSNNSSSSHRGENRAFVRWVLSLLSFFNMGLAALMGTLGILALIGFTPDEARNNLTAAFLSVYMVLFAILLFLYELIWWQPFPRLNRMFRKNFGFLYGLTGKGLYLIFIGFLCLGMKDQNVGSFAGVQGLDWAALLGWLAGGVFHVFISCTWPAANECYKPSSAGFLSTNNSETHPSSTAADASATPNAV